MAKKKVKAEVKKEEEEKPVPKTLDRTQAYVIKWDGLYISTEYSMSNMAGNAKFFSNYDMAEKWLNGLRLRGIKAKITVVKVVDV